MRKAHVWKEQRGVRKGRVMGQGLQGGGGGGGSVRKGAEDDGAGLATGGTQGVRGE